ncbi:MAG TPA: hypothetical protein VFV47_14380, partial [Hyphomicrobiaceae bacterium]|nr:hypothetical protein [Hyphomicrobiaceae bacterium]
MSIRGRQGAAGRLVALALCGVAMGHPVSAQSTTQDPTELDPSAPLDPMPELGVEWPDMDTPDPVLEPIDDEAVVADDDRSNAIEDSAAARRYVVVLSGLGEASTEEFLQAFHARSALEADDDEPANTAQIDRRARADAELLIGLLQGQGYYDAEVETEIGRNGDLIAVELRATPGARFRFDMVEFPGLAEAGGDAAKLREAFAVKPGEPVVASEVIAAGIALKVALGEMGFATAEIGEQDIVVDHT